MQKKSLLVALFCGALCLTGCLKNEESASVAQVRIAKANELNSIADLNKAKAQAEVIYAQAEATIAQAEAKLREANAALVLAQAETEKVRAELLRVKVQLETVKVEEERVKLQMLEAQLEVALANAEAAKAAAAAAEQYWINQLEQLIADAQIAAVDNARLLLEAESKFLGVESQMADSAKVAAQMYFQALDSVAVYQTQLIELKVMRVLANRAAPEIRDNIYAQIDENRAQIAANNAKIEAYKKYQKLTPEEAEAQYQAASEAAGKAYTAWMEKSQALNEATSTQTTINNKTADFTADWATKFTAVEAEVTVNTKGKKHVIAGKDGDITLWSDEDPKSTPVRYPDVDVYSAGEITSYNDVKITPATIEYDNIKTALDTAVAHRKAIGKIGVGVTEFFVNLQIANLKEDKENLTKEVEAHKKYVAVMKDSVDKYENAYLDSLAKSKRYAQEAEDAWETFQAYMLYTYPTVSRELFKLRVQAQNEYDEAVVASTNAATAYNTMVENIPTYKGNVVAKHNAYEQAIGAWRKAVSEVYGPESDIAEDMAAYNEAKENWNPNYIVGGKTNLDDRTDIDFTTVTASTLGDLYNMGTTPGSTVPTKIDGTDAKPVQKTLYIANRRVEAAEQQLYILEQALVRNPKGSAGYEHWKGQMAKFTAETAPKGEYVLAYEALDAAELAVYGKPGSTTQIGAKAKYEKAWESVQTYVTAAHDTTTYNPLILDKDFHKIVKYPTDANPEEKYYVNTDYYKDGKWVIESLGGKDRVLGSAQKELVEAVKSVVDANKKTAKPNGELYADMMDKQRTTENKFIALTTANENLYKEILRVDELNEEEKAEAAEFKDDEIGKLYKDFAKKSAKVGSVDVTAAWNTLLKKAYSFNPDEIGPLDEDFNKPSDNIYNMYYHQFGWLISSYNVDYEATCLNPAGEEVSIASFLYPFSWNPAENSLKYQLEETVESIEVTLPGILSAVKTFFDNDIKAYEKKVAGIVATVNGYKADEPAYKAWVAEREAAAEAVAEATKNEFDAQQDLNKAKANYVAARAALNGGVIYEIWDTNRSGKYDFKKISINEEIAKLENENENLEKQNERWYQTLSDGKVALALVNQILDEMIEKTEEAIAIWNGIANKYKAIMDAYIGTDDKTGPLDGEDEE